ncbi:MULTISPECIES: sugar kinase [Streptomyces]|uniref:Sugar kinase n=1 Tax=Streptomyces dengpaensis TaxID=2049881 RepID=A0ABM6T1K9_9ACTN|nr:MULTISPECIES: sugar kinase [Streptomyces]AVH60631.1 sugar kinase [Streptomyces dengpaensis]PIB02760.1 carbohydrate kinase [Streptomyces sp. HG99]
MSIPWPPRPGPVVCIGETMAALTPDPLTPLDDADLLRVDIAGAESNVALYLADHGIPARWVSAVGDDPLGRRVREKVSAGGVDISGVRTDPERPTGLLLKDPGTNGTRVHYHRRGSAASALTPELLDDPAVADAAVIHLSGITPALSPSCHALVEQALRPDRPFPVSFDVNYRPALWTGRSAAEVLRPLADRADIVLVGLDEAQALWGDGLTDSRAVREFLPGPLHLVVKDGARTATAFVGQDVRSVPALTVRVTEPVGAGDAFAAGFLSGLLRRLPVERALRLGHLTAASALRVTADHGPLPAPDVLAALLAADDATWCAARID